MGLQNMGFNPSYSLHLGLDQPGRYFLYQLLTAKNIRSRPIQLSESPPLTRGQKLEKVLREKEADKNKARGYQSLLAKYGNTLGSQENAQVCTMFFQCVLICKQFVKEFKSLCTIKHRKSRMKASSTHHPNPNPRIG